MARVLIVEDENDIQQVIAYGLKAAGHDAACVGTAELALERIREALPDIVLVDWMLPGMSGIELARRLRASPRTGSIPIIMLTARGAEGDRISGLDSGADDYITKPFSTGELHARIKAVLRRRAPEATDDAVEIAGLRLDPVGRRVTANGVPVNMGPTEFRLLHYLMTHPGRIYSRAQLLDNVWGDHVFVTERNVDVHIRRLRKVLEPTRHDRHIETVRNAGYRFSAGEAP